MQLLGTKYINRVKIDPFNQLVHLTILLRGWKDGSAVRILVFTKDQSSVSSTYVRELTTPSNFSSRGSNALHSSGLCGYVHTLIQTHIPTYELENKSLKKKIDGLFRLRYSFSFLSIPLFPQD